MSLLRQLSEEQQLSERADRVMPGGTFGNISSRIVIRSGRGGRVWDVSGNEYIDYLLGSGPMLVGHCHPEVNAAVIEQLDRGSTFFANNEFAIRLAEQIVEAVPCAEQLRFTCTGTEADAYAMRLVRAFRKRSKILKFEGAYHGMSDYGLMSLWPTAPRNSPFGIPDSAGIPDSIRDEILVAPFNDLEAAKQLIYAHRDELAGVIVEPMQRLIPPAPGFLQGLRNLTSEYGIPLVFDEVVTGFRLSYGGGQAYYNVIPDVCTLGKAIGGGYPLAAVAGRADIMAHFDEAKVSRDLFLPQIGTLSGNPVAAVAGLATLQILKRPGTYENLFQTGRAIWEGIEACFKEAGLPVIILGEPVMFDALFTSQENIREYRASINTDKAIGRKFNSLLRQFGIFKTEGKMYISVAHNKKDVSDTIVAYRRAIEMLMSAAQ